MKKIIIATTFLFILSIIGCKMGDPIIGSWKMMSPGYEVIGGNEEYIAFSTKGTWSQNFLLGGKWKRLDENHLELITDPIGQFGEKTRNVTIKIEGDILTITESNGRSSKFKRDK